MLRTVLGVRETSVKKTHQVPCPCGIFTLVWNARHSTEVTAERIRGQASLTNRQGQHYDCLFTCKEMEVV